MKVAVLNYCGTVGKTTLAAHLLKPRLADSIMLSIESINDDVSTLGLESEKFKGGKFIDVYKKLLVEDNCILDVGASNIEEFLDRMIKFQDSHEELDLFIVPVTPGQKEQRETVTTITALVKIGVPSEKIRVILNRVEDEPEAEFPLIFGAAKKLNFPLNKNCSVYTNEVYDLLNKRSKTVDAVLNDETDYKALLKEAIIEDDNKKVNECTDMLALRSLAKGVKDNLDLVYSEIIK